MSDRFRGVTALVTGAGSGIGEATSRALVDRGAMVWLVDLHEDRIAALQKELGEDKTRTATVDVSDRQAMTALAERVHAETGPLSILVNNAGYALVGSALDCTVDQWERQLGVNLMGVVYGVQLFGPSMAEAGGPASIVNIASAAGFTGLPMMSAYSVSKCAVRAYSQSMAAEWDDQTLHVACVCPGFLPTRIGEDGEYAGNLDEKHQRKRLNKLLDHQDRGPNDVAKAIIRGIERRELMIHLYPESWQLDIARRILPERWLRAFKRRAVRSR